MCACVPGRCLSAFVSPVCTQHLLYLMSTEFQADPLCVGIQPDSGERVAPTTKAPPPHRQSQRPHLPSGRAGFERRRRWCFKKHEKPSK